MHDPVRRTFLFGLLGLFLAGCGGGGDDDDDGNGDGDGDGDGDGNDPLVRGVFLTGPVDANRQPILDRARPVAGATIVVHSADQCSADRGSQCGGVTEERRVMTGADGRFSVPFSGPGTFVFRALVSTPVPEQSPYQGVPPPGVPPAGGALYVAVIQTVTLQQNQGVDLTLYFIE